MYGEDADTLPLVAILWDVQALMDQDIKIENGERVDCKKILHMRNLPIGISFQMIPIEMRVDIILILIELIVEFIPCRKFFFCICRRDIFFLPVYERYEQLLYRACSLGAACIRRVYGEDADTLPLVAILWDVQALTTPSSGTAQ